MTAESGQTIVSITQWFPSFHAMTFCVHMHAKSCQKIFIFQQILELCPIQLQHQSLAYPFTGIPEHRLHRSVPLYVSIEPKVSLGLPNHGSKHKNLRRKQSNVTKKHPFKPYLTPYCHPLLLPHFDFALLR